MADEQSKDPRSIDERRDAITMNLELQMRQQADRWQRSSDAFEDVRESIRSIAKRTEQLLRTAQAHQERIERRVG